MALQLYTGSFAISKKLYATDPSTYQVAQTLLTDKNDTPIWQIECHAIWYKSLNRQPVLCYGKLWSSASAASAPSYEEFIKNYDGKRYGGKMIARWDGQEFWSQVVKNRDDQNRLIKDVLEPIRLMYPRLPSGYQGWLTPVD